jgi:hypothetical protein
MRKALTVALVALLAGCASYAGRGLVPGQSSAAEVEAVMGPAAERREFAGGESALYFPRQPYGRQTFVARIGPDGRLLAIEQRLTEQNIALIVPGTSDAEDVRDLFGPPYQTNVFANQQRETWTYKMYQGQFQKELYVQMSPDRIVREVMLVDEPRSPTDRGFSFGFRF